MFEVRWNKPFATNFFGKFVQAQGFITVPAQLAIKLHESKEGWVCDEILKARASLEAGNSVIAGIPVSIDDVPHAGTLVTTVVDGEVVEGELAAEHPKEGELVGPPEEVIIMPTPELRPGQGELIPPAETVNAPAEGEAAPVDEKPASPAVKAAKAEAAKNRRNKNNPK